MTEFQNKHETYENQQKLNHNKQSSKQQGNQPQRNNITSQNRAQMMLYNSRPNSLRHKLVESRIIIEISNQKSAKQLGSMSQKSRPKSKP